MAKYISRLGIGLLLSGWVVACGEPRDEDTLDPGLELEAALVDCPSDTTYEASSLVLPAGGAVSLRGHSVSLPVGAVPAPTLIGIAEPASPYMLIDLSAAGQEHFQFEQPLTVTVSYARCTDASLDGGPLSVWLVEPATGALLENMGGTDDRTARTMTFQTDHFSGYAIAN